MDASQEVVTLVTLEGNRYGCEVLSREDHGRDSMLVARSHLFPYLIKMGVINYDDTFSIHYERSTYDSKQDMYRILYVAD